MKLVLETTDTQGSPVRFRLNRNNVSDRVLPVSYFKTISLFVLESEESSTTGSLLEFTHTPHLSLSVGVSLGVFGFLRCHTGSLKSPFPLVTLPRRKEDYLLQH